MATKKNVRANVTFVAKSTYTLQTQTLAEFFFHLVQLMPHIFVWTGKHGANESQVSLPRHIAKKNKTNIHLPCLLVVCVNTVWKRVLRKNNDGMTMGTRELHGEGWKSISTVTTKLLWPGRIPFDPYTGGTLDCHHKNEFCHKSFAYVSE